MSFYIKWEQNYKAKLNNIITYILMSWFKTKNTERRKTSFPKETVENSDLHKAALNKTMTSREQCVKCDFVAPLISPASGKMLKMSFKVIMSRTWKLSLSDVLKVNFSWIFVNIVQTSEKSCVYWANSKNNLISFWICIDVYIPPLKDIIYLNLHALS